MGAIFFNRFRSGGVVKTEIGAHWAICTKMEILKLRETFSLTFVTWRIYIYGSTWYFVLQVYSTLSENCDLKRIHSEHYGLSFNYSGGIRSDSRLGSDHPHW